MGNEAKIAITLTMKDDGSVVVENFNRKVNESTDNIKSMAGSLSLIKFDSIINLGQRAFNTAEQVYRLTRTVAASGDEIKRTAGVLGMTTTDFQKFQYMAMRSDVSAQGLTISVRNLSRVMGEAAQGSGESAEALQSIGVSATDTSGKLKPLDQMVGEIAEKFSRLKDGPEKIALAMKLFGRSGEEIIPMLNQGKKGLEELKIEFEKLGIAISPEMLDKMSKADESFERFEAKLKTLKAVGLSPVVVEMGHLIDKLVGIISLTERISKGGNIPESISKTIGNREAWLKARQNLGWNTPEEAKELAASQSKAKPGSEIPKPGETLLSVNAEAAKKLSEALQEAAKYEGELNRLYADDVEKFKTLNLLADARVKAMDLMEQLGVKTKIGAEREVGGIKEKFKSLLGMGYSDEELEEAKKKLEEDLKKIQEKYSQPSGWKETEFEEGRVRWHQNIPKAGLTGDVETMVQSAIEDLQRMQAQAVAATAPRTMMIDYKPVQNAKEAVEELRKAMESIDGKVITISIDGRMAINGESIQKIEDELGARYKNKRSGLRSIVQKDNEYSNY